MRPQNVKGKANQHPLIMWLEPTYALHVKYTIEVNDYLRYHSGSLFATLRTRFKMLQYCFSLHRRRISMLIAKLRDLGISAVGVVGSIVLRFWGDAVLPSCRHFEGTPMSLQNVRNYVPNNNVTPHKTWHLNYHIICTQQSIVLSTSNAAIMVSGRSGVPRNFFFEKGGGSTNSVEDRGERERGSGGSWNLVQEISFHMVKFS